jgi:hypothetical protein
VCECSVHVCCHCKTERKVVLLHVSCSTAGDNKGSLDEDIHYMVSNNRNFLYVVTMFETDRNSFSFFVPRMHKRKEDAR